VLVEKHWLKSYPPGVRPEINVNEYPSLKEMIERGLAIHSVRDAYVQMGKAMTFGELDVLSAQFGAFLQTACGLKKGDRVASHDAQRPAVPQSPCTARCARAQPSSIPTRYTRRGSSSISSSTLAATVIVIQRELCARAAGSDRAHAHQARGLHQCGRAAGIPKGAIVNFVVRHKRKQVKAIRPARRVEFP
jgi:long-chain acyl-CoA synthetase